MAGTIPPDFRRTAGCVAVLMGRRNQRTFACPTPEHARQEFGPPLGAPGLFRGYFWWTVRSGPLPAWQSEAARKQFEHVSGRGALKQRVKSLKIEMKGQRA